MQIIISNTEKYENKINKYFSNQKKYKRLETISNIFFASACVCLCTFYIFLAVYLISKILDKGTSLYFNGMIFCIIAGFLLGVSLICCELSNVRLSWKEKIYLKITKNKKAGFEPIDLNLWYDDDKIRAYIVFKNEENQTINEYCRLDEFLIKYQDTDDIILNFDNTSLIMPKEKEKENIVSSYYKE